MIEETVKTCIQPHKKILQSISKNMSTKFGDELVTSVMKDGRGHFDPQAIMDDISLLHYVNQQMDQFMLDVESGKAYNEEYPPDMIELAEQIIRDNPQAFKNFL